ncbi:VENN motif pre-toxin domain-containing protein [Actinobacillus sp. GY-402]|nr:VENN motif pre-toxin domain-containing protein [Actinobacillus sp. GY-402]
MVATLSQVTAGLAGIIASDSTQSAVSATEIGKRAVENNYNAVPFVENIDGNSLKAMAEIQTQQAERNESVRALIEREHPIIYKGSQDTYYILSKTGEAIYITREIVMDVAPILLAPLLSRQEDKQVYDITEEYRSKGMLPKYKQEQVSTLLAKDTEIDRLLYLYQTEPEKLTEAQKAYLDRELKVIAASYDIPIENLYQWDFSHVIKRDDSALKSYLSSRNALSDSYDMKQAQSLKTRIRGSFHHGCKLWISAKRMEYFTESRSSD